MEIISSKTNLLGTTDFIMKLGRMKKAESFITYSANNGCKKLYIQSEHRWAEIELESGKILLSARRAQYATPSYLTLCIINGTAEEDMATQEQLEYIKEAIRKSGNRGYTNFGTHTSI